MRAYLAVHHRRRTDGFDEQVRRAARRTLPFTTSGEPDGRWSSPDGAFELFAWTNEPEQPGRPLLTTGTEQEPGALGYTGQPRGGPSTAAELARGWSNPGGVWSMVAATPDALVAQTCASGIEMMFHTETPDLVAVGNRALLVHLVADETGPHPDLLGLAGVICTGYAVTTHTAFRGVSALPVWSRLRVTASGIQLDTHDARSVSAEPDAVAEALLASVQPLVGSDQPLGLGLTGGRDSRLLAALLWRAGVPFTTRTSGEPDDPDVVVAQEVAGVLGLPHRVGAPKGVKRVGDTLTVDVAGRLKAAVVLGEGMLSAYDKTGEIDAAFDASRLNLSGAGGEILRAYFAHGLEDLGDRKAAERSMSNRLLSQAGVLTATARADYEQRIEPWLAQARAEGGIVLEDFFVRQRMGRWVGAAHGSGSVGSLQILPYLDHQVVAAARGVPAPHRISERLIAELLHDLAPQLSDVRFAGRRWLFDEAPPADPAARAAWEARAPVQSTRGSEPNLSWRTDLVEVRDELARTILQAPDPFWELVDRDTIARYVSDRRSRTPVRMRKMWNLATVATAITHDFHTDADRWRRGAVPLVAAVPKEPDTAAEPAPGTTSRPGPRPAPKPGAQPTVRRRARRLAGRVVRGGRRRVRRALDRLAERTGRQG